METLDEAVARCAALYPDGPVPFVLDSGAVVPVDGWHDPSWTPEQAAKHLTPTRLKSWLRTMSFSPGVKVDRFECDFNGMTDHTHDRKFAPVGGKYKGVIATSDYGETMVQSCHVDTGGAQHALRVYLAPGATNEEIQGAERGLVSVLHIAALCRAGHRFEDVAPQSPYQNVWTQLGIETTAQALYDRIAP